ncbi:fasciclin domain-containing protein [Planctomycetaceae bacterium]|nr:fasciclin domain-containing protein [Planctomycetaceae bacterium]
MVRGGKLRVSSESGNTRVNDAVIIESDIWCSDGIIHAIDTVLIPNLFNSFFNRYGGKQDLRNNFNGSKILKRCVALIKKRAIYE